MITSKKYTDKLEELKNLNYIERDIIPEKEPVFNVFLNTRTIDVPDGFNKQLALMGEHNAETIWFTLDRYFDGEDLAAANKKWAIQFESSSLTNLLPITYKYVAEDELLGDNQTVPQNPSFNSRDEKTLKLGWKIHKEVTQNKGTVSVALRCFTIEPNEDGVNEVTYDLKTKPINLIIGDALNITDASENLTVPASRLDELVTLIEELYANESARLIRYTELEGSSLPKIDGKVLLDDVSSSNFTNISFGQLQNKPQINVDGKAYTIGVDTINVTKVDVDSELGDTENPVQNKAVNAKFTEVDSNISKAVQDFEGQIGAANGEIDGLDKRIAALEEEMENMVYIPLKIKSFTSSIETAEKNSTLNTNITFDWDIEGNVASQLLALSGGEEVEVDANARTYTYNFGDIKDNAAFILTARDRKGLSTTAEAKIDFTYKIYYGVAETKEEFQTIFGTEAGVIQKDAKITFEVTPTETQYIYFAAPLSYNVKSFTVGGFNGGFTQVAIIDYNGANYGLWQSVEPNLGNTIVTVA